MSSDTGLQIMLSGMMSMGSALVISGTEQVLMKVGTKLNLSTTTTRVSGGLVAIGGALVVCASVYKLWQMKVEETKVEHQN
jgi:hypothetical protein